jgi:hypothetical protein
VLSGNGKALKMSSIHLLFAFCFMGGGEGEGVGARNPMSKSPLQELGFLTEKKKDRELFYVCRAKT